MKIRTILLISFTALFISLGNAQNINWGESEKSTTDSKPYSIIGNDSKGVYLLKYYDAHPNMPSGYYSYVMTLEKYDLPGLKRDYSKELFLTEDGTEKGPEMYYSDMFCMKDNMVLLMYGNDVQTLYGMKVKPDGSLDKKVKIGMVANKFHKSVVPESGYRFSLSRDKSALVGFYVNYQIKDKLNLTALDQNAGSLWTKEVENPFKGKKTSNIIKMRSLSGDVVYVLASFGKKDDPDGYGVLMYNHKTDAIVEYDVELGGTNSANVIDLDADNSGNAVIAGYYGDEKSKETIIGTFNVRLDNSGKSTINKITPFDKDMLEHNISDAKIEKGKGIEQINLANRNKIVVKDDGTAIFSAEQFNNSSSTETGEYDYYNVIVSKINTDGTAGWAKCVAKKQGCRSNAAHFICSYSLYAGDKKVYVVFNDADKNMKINSDGVLGGDNSDLSLKMIDMVGTNPTPMMMTYDIASGAAARRIISLGKGDNNLRYYSDIYYQPASTKVYIYKGGNGTFDQLGEFPLE